jgi:hypothetical protein
VRESKFFAYTLVTSLPAEEGKMDISYQSYWPELNPPPRTYPRPRGSGYNSDEQYYNDPHQNSPQPNNSQSHLGQSTLEEKQESGWQHSQPPQAQPFFSEQSCYKPTALKWPFLAAEFILLTLALIAVLILQRGFPDSDSSAIIDGRSVMEPSSETDEGTWGFARHARNWNGTGGVLLSSDEKGSRSATLPMNTLSNATGIFTGGQGFTPTGRRKYSFPTNTFTETTPMVTAPVRETNVSRTTASIILPGPNYYSNGVAHTITSAIRVTATPSTDDRPMQTSNVAETTSPEPVLPPSQPALTTVSVILSGVTTTLLLTTVAPAVVQTTFDESGSPVIIWPTTIIQTVQTIVVVIGGHIAQSVITDINLTADITTIVTEVGGTPTAYVTTPPPETIVHTITNSGDPDIVMTEVVTPPPLTIATTVGGSLITLLAVSTPGRSLTETIIRVVGGTAVTITPAPVTFVHDVGGLIVATTSTPAPYVTTTGGTTMTLLHTTTIGRVITTSKVMDINGTLTTMAITVTETPTPSTRWTTLVNNAHPTGSGSGGNSGDSSTTTIVIPSFSDAYYLAGIFLPTLIAVIIVVPINIIEKNVKLMQPFRNLAVASGPRSTTDGATGPDTLTLRFTGGFLGMHAVTTQFILAFRCGQLVPLLASSVMWLSYLLPALSAEAIGFKIHGACSHLNITGCAIALGVSPAPTNALIAVLSVMLFLLVVLALLLHRWETGVYANPWSFAGVASLSLCPQLREPLTRNPKPTEKDLDDMFRYGRFRLGIFDLLPNSDRLSRFNGESNYEYGIVPIWEDSHGAINNVHKAVSSRTEDNVRVPFHALTYIWRMGFMGLLLGLIALLLYYHGLDQINAFELFMDSQTFGVKFLFAALGSIISMFWSEFFESYVTITPFVYMTRQACPASRSVLLARPTNSFSGAVEAVRQGDLLLICVALMAITAELFLPVVLSNIPYGLTQTLATHTACTFVSLGILAAMVTVLCLSMILVRWPEIPVDPRTLAGAMYYVACSLRLLDDMRGRGVSTRRDENRNAKIKSVERRYYYTKVDDSGSEAKSRMMIDMED